MWKQRFGLHHRHLVVQWACKQHIFQLDSLYHADLNLEVPVYSTLRAVVNRQNLTWTPGFTVHYVLNESQFLQTGILGTADLNLVEAILYFFCVCFLLLVASLFGCFAVSYNDQHIQWILDGQAGRRLVRSLTNSIRHLCFHVYMHW